MGIHPVGDGRAARHESRDPHPGQPVGLSARRGADKLVFIDKSNLDAKVEIPITIPSCRDIFDVTLDKELKFNAAAEIYNSMNGDWSPGAARGSVKGIRGARIYVIAEVTDRWGNTSLSGDETDTKWVTVTENAWDDDLVIMDRGFTIGTQVNQGDPARHGSSYSRHRWP